MLGPALMVVDERDEVVGHLGRPARGDSAEDRYGYSLTQNPLPSGSSRTVHVEVWVS